MRSIWAKPSLSRDFALLSILIIFVSLLVSLRVAFVTYADYADKVLGQLENESARIDRTLTMEIKNASAVLEPLARQIIDHGPQDILFITRLLGSFNNEDSSERFFSWIDNNQQMLVTVTGLLEKPVDVSDRDYVKKSLAEPWKLQIGRPIEGRVSGRWIVPMSMGLTDGNGKFAGTLVVSLDIKAVSEKLRSLIDPGLSFAITSLTFAKLTQFSPDESFLEDFFPKDRLAAIDYNRQPHGVFSKASLINPTEIYAYYRLSDLYPYLILVGYDAKFSTMAILKLLWPRLTQLFIMAVFLVLLLWLLRLRIIRPVIELTESAARIARGDSLVPLPRGGPSEVEALSGQIRKISDYISERKRIEDELQHKTSVLKRAKEAAELTNRIKIDFLTSMGQQLKTPIMNIVGLSEVIRERLAGKTQENADVAHSLADIHQSAEQILEMVNDVLILSKAESGITELKEKPLKVALTLQKCVRLMREKLDQRGINVALIVPDKLPQLLMDELRFKQIVINLLSNAMKFTPQGGEISVEARLESDKRHKTLAISFTDGGQSLSPRIMSHSFEMGSSGEGSVVQRNKLIFSDFSGVGIQLSKTLVAMHQASLDVQNIPGRGNVVTLRFPGERLIFTD